MFRQRKSFAFFLAVTSTLLSLCTSLYCVLGNGLYESLCPAKEEMVNRADVANKRAQLLQIITAKQATGNTASVNCAIAVLTSFDSIMTGMSFWFMDCVSSTASSQIDYTIDFVLCEYVARRDSNFAKYLFCVGETNPLSPVCTYGDDYKWLIAQIKDDLIKVGLSVSYDSYVYDFATYVRNCVDRGAIGYTGLANTAIANANAC